MLKALMDALYEDDSHVWDCRITKIWGEGQIIIGVSMTLDHFMQYQTESVKRASMPPVAKHNLNQTKPKQPKRAAA
jgi:hypothetical protein